MEEFRKLGLSELTVKALERKGFKTPTSIQTRVIPILLKGERDVVGQSQTGTGKTACFALPILEKLTKTGRVVQAIILTPTRELAIQVAKEIESLRGDTSVKLLAVYGGSGIDSQMKKLKSGIDIVVGTPGRVMDLQRRKALKLDNIQYAVLDEADEMLNMGFVEDIETILKNTPKEKNMLLFSATMPKPILKIAKKYMKDYELVESESTNVIIDTVEQIYYDISAKDRVEGIRRVIDYNPDFHGIVFCNTKASVDTVARQLSKMDYSAAALHGDITQSQREKILQQFRDNKVKALIATDVAARGIDVNDLTHVINFSLPQSPESYVHRIGRTGRAGKKGIAITFLMPSERQRLSFVERVNNCKLKKEELPSVKEIIQHKEFLINDIIKSIVAASKGKESKYDLMADELLAKYEAKDAIAAILKYSFKNELESTNYKQLSKPKSGEALPADANTGRGRGGSRGGNRNGGNFRRDRKSGDRRGNSRGGDRRGSSRRGSDRPNRGRGRGDSKGDSPSSKFKSDRSSRSNRPRFEHSSEQSDRPRSKRPGSRDRASKSNRPGSDRPKPPRSERKPRHRDRR